jgi:hypothetical protein
MRLPDVVLNTVCFIGLENAGVLKYGGTGFIVAVKGEHQNAYPYLVTAKHVVDKIADIPFVIGMNTHNSGTAIMDANFDADHKMNWWFHPTEPNAVDAAVAVFNPADYNKLAVEWVFYPEMFVTEEIRKKTGIGIGDEVATIGLFTSFQGAKKLFPIVRIGNLAMLPTERVPFAKGFDPQEMYLVESRSIGGLSGSPVFVRQTVHMDIKGIDLPVAGTGKIHFLGLNHGHWELPSSFGNKDLNAGIAAVTPAQKIIDILERQELVDIRKKYDQEIEKGNAAVLDPGSAKQ